MTGDRSQAAAPAGIPARRALTPTAQGRPGITAPTPVRWTTDTVFLLVATVAVLAARIPVALVRYFDPDEFEHAHAAWCVFKGLVPYQDFFEHHTPWYYYLLAPFFRWFAVDQSFDSARHFLLFARGGSLLLCALAVALLVLAGSHASGAGRRIGLLAGLMLAAQPVVIQKTLEIRPDVPALPFFIGGLWLLSRGFLEADDRRRLRWFAGGGLALGGAIMCTQKMLFVLPGVFTGLGLWALGGRPRWMSPRWMALLVVLAGVALPGFLTWAAFAAHGGGGAFVRNNFLLNVKWRLRTGRNVVETLATSWPVALLALAGAVPSLQRLWRRARPDPTDVLLLCTLAGLLAGIAVIPVPYRQYYLMPIAVACLLAAKGLMFLVELCPPRARPWVIVAAATALMIWPARDLKQSYTFQDPGQMNRLRYVLEHTAPDDQVMDGWLGTGVFRPHAFYYFFMHPELRAMVSKQEIDAYARALELGKIRPALIALDRDLAGLGPRFVAFVRRNLATRDGLFYRPTRDRAASALARFPPCPPQGRPNTPRDPMAFRAAVTRRWAACQSTPVGGEDLDALGTEGAGIEILPDGRYRHLMRDDAGHLATSPGVTSEGHVTYTMTRFGAVQTTFRSDLDQLLATAPELTADPTLLIIRTPSADHRYVPADGP